MSESWTEKQFHSLQGRLFCGERNFASMETKRESNPKKLLKETQANLS